MITQPPHDDEKVEPIEAAPHRPVAPVQPGSHHPQQSVFGQPGEDSEDESAPLLASGGVHIQASSSDTDTISDLMGSGGDSSDQPAPAQPAPAQPAPHGQPAPIAHIPAPVAIPHAPIQMPIGGPAAPVVFGPGNQMGIRQGNAWDAWKKQSHVPAVDAYIRTNQQRNFFQFNDHTNRIEPIYQREHILRNVRFRHGRGKKGRFRPEEVHRLRKHPLNDAYKQKRKAFEQIDPKSHTSRYAEAAAIGEYIKLELMPAVIYIKILKHVQIQALRILARQLLYHCQREPTRIHLKQSRRTGKYSYNVWLSNKKIQPLDENGFYTKLMGITNNGTKSVTLMVKQNKRKGNLQRLWETQHSLL